MEQSESLPQRGIIEGYYGTPWDWTARAQTLQFLAPHGYRFYLYAPKADEFLRRRWREPHPADIFEPLEKFARQCRETGVAFGVGLSPYEIYRGFDDAAKRDLTAKLAQLDALKPDMLAILFDDMRGDLPKLAQTQSAITHWMAERTHAKHIILCPTYYSDAPLLDKVFGARPQNYLEELGEALDPAIAMFWTGDKICTREFTPGHLARVGEQMRRKPFLWDNYPVNDGPRMSPFLHLRAFTGRPAAIGAHIAGHAVNPALQPVLSRIPMLTLAQSYARGSTYDHDAAFVRAAQTVTTPELARALQDDLGLLQDTGLDNLGDAAEHLRTRYAQFDHSAAREILAWLNGAYRFTGEML
ncbi:MAG TPA: beta-N-acetylglucosaminidase domain-containing protein [Rhizomicrobium sp.]|nr:beta-N-acetylglucosaminidase domain-containing protein [Rhizomicrobium sp.]